MPDFVPLHGREPRLPAERDRGTRASRLTARRILAVWSGVSILACGAPEASSELEERRAAIAAAGRQVMPFDLDATTHVFEKAPFGGLQQVVADSDDPRQIELVREHLEVEAERFARGDFRGPGMIHGEDMAGLHQLIEGHRELSIEYAEIERGAQILFRTEDSGLLGAIHAWFDAQLRDHGSHARGRPF